jgi:hypothetical protein
MNKLLTIENLKSTNFQNILKLGLAFMLLFSVRHVRVPLNVQLKFHPFAGVQHCIVACDERDEEARIPRFGVLFSMYNICVSVFGETDGARYRCENWRETFDVR